MSLSIHSDFYESEPCLEIRGPCTQQDLDRLIKAFKKALPNVTKALYLRLANVPYMDSAALGVIIFNYNELVKTSRKLVILSPSAEIQRLLRTTSLDRLLSVRPA